MADFNARRRNTSENIDSYRADRYTSRRRKRRGGNVAKWIILALLGLVLLFGISLGASAFTMVGSLDGVKGEVKALKKEITSGDYAAAQTTSQKLADRAQSLNKQASGPQWKLASLLPFVGSDISTLRAMTSSADTLAQSVLVPATTKLQSSGAGPLLGDEARIDATALQAIISSLGEASDTLHQQNEGISNLAPCSIDELDSLRGTFTGAIDALDTLSTAAPQLSARIPWLLGAEGEPRTYLLVAQNNVEMRSTGGYPGSLGPLTINDGKMDIGDFVAVTSLGRFDDEKRITIDAEPFPITAEEQTLFGARMQLVPGDANYTPSFPRAAQVWDYTWEITGRGTVDGVIAVDPVFLQDVLGLVGSVQASDGTMVTGSNAAKLLMHDTYWSKESAEQDAFFAEVAGLVFDKLFEDVSSIDVAGLSKTLLKGASEGRVCVYSDDADVQAALSTMGIDGELGHDASKPTLGVYFCDDTWSKMFWYFSADTTIDDGTKNADGSTSYKVVTTIKNNIPANEAAALPDYVAGDNFRLRSNTDMLAWVYLVAPQDGSITDVSAEGTFCDNAKMRKPFYGDAPNRGMNEGMYYGLDVWYGIPQMDAGEQTVISYTVTTAPDASGEQAALKLDTTPTAQDVAGW